MVMPLLVVFTFPESPDRWRPHEKEALESQFGQISEIGVGQKAATGPDLTVLWKMHAEINNVEKWQTGLVWEGMLNSNISGHLDLHQINPPSGWPAVHSKDVAFRAWTHHGIPCPKFCIFIESGKFAAAIEEAGIKPPYLLRLNDGNTGEWSHLIQENQDPMPLVEQLLDQEWKQAELKYGPPMFRAGMAVQFIDHLRFGLRYSYRIIVAGNEVVAGYARACDPDDWVAITSKFRPEIADAWMTLNEECETFCREQKDLILRAVHCLGLDWQGIDVIFDDKGRPYFLEVQPDYSCGNPRHGDLAPWYNPSYPDLVKFLKDNEAEVRRRIPWYWDCWLDKKNHFRLCAKALGAYLK